MKRILLLLTILALCYTNLNAQTIKGKVTDKSGEPLIGVVVRHEGSTSAVATELDGQYTLKNLPTEKPITIEFLYVGMKDHKVEIIIPQNQTVELNATLEEQATDIDQIQVVARRRRNNEASMIAGIRSAQAVVTGISAAQISKSSDSDAGEVVKRIPGISLIDNRFIIVRGLSQRYNNVWINGGAVPSTEADGRAFSFDIIPSSQIDNLVIVKSPTAELPADFSGGFIKITTKDTPEKSSVSLNLTSGFNTVTQFHDTRLPEGSSTDWLGFDAGKRPLSKDFPANLGAVTSPQQMDHLLKNGFNNDWSIRQFRPLPDIKASVAWNAVISPVISMTLTAGYSSVFKTLLDMKNTRYGIYSSQSDRPVVEKDYTDNQFNHDVKINAMNNWVFRFDPNNRLEFRNLFNLMGKNRLVERYGVSVVSGEYFEKQTEMRYTSRLTYTGQLSGKHTFGDDRSHSIDWNGSYSYANKNEPDRRIISNRGSIPSDGVISPDTPSYNDRIARYFQDLNDNIASAGIDYKKRFSGNWQPELKAGLYGEYRSRDYTPREFIYRYDRLSQADRDQYIYLPYEQMMDLSWIGSDKVYADETTRKSNAYTGNNTIGAAYLSAALPFGKFNLYLGVRAELWDMNITYDRAMSASQNLITTNNYNELSILPSINATYNFNDKHLLRAAYGRSVNRPEFREVSPSVYYDFDLFAEIQGNPELKMATIDNVDLRWEFYPSPSELISVGLFYKHFTNPIEWTFVDMGGSYRYSYQNAATAYTAGAEVEVRKSLDFIGVPELTLVLNGAYVLSEVTFNEGGLVTEKNRPLQGQSPFIVNAGLYYTSNDKLGLSASVLYNIIGKRIMGVGKSISSNTDLDIPDSYEMPRSVLDITIAKKIGKIVEIKFSAKDILNEPVTFKQFPTTTINSQQVTREQTTVNYRQGVSFSIGVALKF